jgi:hypothetical protein
MDALRGGLRQASRSAPPEDCLAIARRLFFAGRISPAHGGGEVAREADGAPARREERPRRAGRSVRLRGITSGIGSGGNTRHLNLFSPAGSSGTSRFHNNLPDFRPTRRRMGFRGSPVQIRPSRLARVKALTSFTLLWLFAARRSLSDKPPVACKHASSLGCGDIAGPGLAAALAEGVGARGQSGTVHLGCGRSSGRQGEASRDLRGVPSGWLGASGVWSRCSSTPMP